jgi:transposase
MPAPTPQTATRKIRSQSPPRRVQRTPVSQMHAAIPASSISPYMWIVTGPRSSVPEDGEGMEARRLTAASILPAAADG